MKLNRANYDGDMVIVLTFSGIAGQVALDTQQHLALPDFGLTYRDELNSAQIASVTLQRNNTELLIELNQSPTGTKRGLTYVKEGNIRDGAGWCPSFTVGL